MPAEFVPIRDQGTRKFRSNEIHYSGNSPGRSMPGPSRKGAWSSLHSRYYGNNLYAWGVTSITVCGDPDYPSPTARHHGCAHRTTSEVAISRLEKVLPSFPCQQFGHRPTLLDTPRRCLFCPTHRRGPPPACSVRQTQEGVGPVGVFESRKLWPPAPSCRPCSGRRCTIRRTMSARSACP